MEDSPQKIRHSTGETYECDREFERKRRTNVCNSADVEDSPRNGVENSPRNMENATMWKIRHGNSLS